MIVYGDLERELPAAEAWDKVRTMMTDAAARPPGLEYHAGLVRAFIAAAEYVQGIADAEFETRGRDDRSPLQDAGAELLLGQAQAMDISWRCGFSEAPVLDGALNRLATLRGEGNLRMRSGEGFAHYALYPEAYLEAARGSGLSADSCVIGIRSIGIGLAALVAAAIGARPALSVRPVGHPFGRAVRANPDLVAGHIRDPSVRFAIVDEGPGLSGSSLAGVAAWLLSLGVAPERIHFFPGHGGEPGPAATAETRAIWAAVRRHPASAADVIAQGSGLAGWVEDLIGACRRPMRDITSATPAGAAGAPEPRDARFERRKFLAVSDTGIWLLKFAGLGEIGERKHRDLARLARAGLGPEVAGFRHGFTVQRWIEPAATVVPDERRLFVRTLGRYLAFRSRLSPAGPGATLAALRSMSVHNTSECLGAEAGAQLAARLEGIEALQGRVRPLRTDNRLHAWEWIIAETGLLKLDAIDHCEGHDLVGCQDVAWDVAGAMVEHDLSAAELEELGTLLREGGVGLDRVLLATLLPCYLAFQLGLWSTASPVTAATRDLADRYAGGLAAWLGRG